MPDGACRQHRVEGTNDGPLTEHPEAELEIVFVHNLEGRKEMDEIRRYRHCIRARPSASTHMHEFLDHLHGRGGSHPPVGHRLDNAATGALTGS